MAWLHNQNDHRRAFLRDSALGMTVGMMASGQIAGLPQVVAGESAATEVGGSYNVRSFGAKGDGSTDDFAAIQAAIDAASKAQGGVVFLPPGVYRTTQSLKCHSSHVALCGVGGASIIRAVGDFDTVVFAGMNRQQIYRNRLSDILFDERGKTGGRTLFGDHVAQLIVERVYGDTGWDAWHFHNFNYVAVNDCRFDSYRGTCYGRATGGGKEGGRSDVLRLTGLVHGGTRTPGMIGLDIDGFVHTVNGLSLYMVGIGAQCLWARNTIEAENNPSFFTFTDLECDFPDGECIRLDVGEHFYFNNTMVHGARGAVPNIHVGENATTVSFTGGFSTGAQQAGMRIAGKNVSISAMHFHANSSVEFGGHKSTYPGILIAKSARDVMITGCRAGRESTKDSQNVGCQIEEGADGVVITGNDFRYNVQQGVLNAAGTGRATLISNNL